MVNQVLQKFFLYLLRYPITHFDLIKNKKFFIKDLYTGATQVWSIQEILREINRGHSDEYTPYNETDWKEGWNEWVEWDEYYSFIGEQPA